MCLNPFLIDNPYYGLMDKGLNYLHDCKHTKLEVPCGKCPSCIALKQMYFTQRVFCESFDNYLFFGTLTYNRKMMRTIEVNGYSLKYADFKDWQNMIKRIRKNNLIPRGFRYWVVSEYGTSDDHSHRPHFHFLLSVPKLSSDDQFTVMNLEAELHSIFLSNWSRNIGTNRKPIYEPCCTYINCSKGRTFDLHYLDPSSSSEGEADVSFYVSKYLLKYSKYVDSLHSALKLNLDPVEFQKVWSLLVPRCQVSHNWGNLLSPTVKRHIRFGIDLAIADPSLTYPVFVNPVSGCTSPLSPFLKSKFFTVIDAHSFYFKQKDDDDRINGISEISRIDKLESAYKQHSKIIDHLNSFEDV